MTIFKNIQLALLLWMFAMLSGVASVTPGAPLKFFIYDDPEWHKMGTFTMSKRHPTERMENVLNRGAGPEINRAEGVYHTNQYQLYNNMYHRALRDPRRTLDPEEATTFFLPYDIASDAAKYQGCPKNTSKTCYDFNKCVLAPKVEKMLLASPYYRRNGGSDHMMLGKRVCVMCSTSCVSTLCLFACTVYTCLILIRVHFLSGSSQLDSIMR
jgi:hypothetical protein